MKIEILKVTSNKHLVYQDIPLLRVELMTYRNGQIEFCTFLDVPELYCQAKGDLFITPTV